MLTRINNRSKIYKAKFYAQVIYWLFVTILFVIFSIACYYMFISKLEISSGQFIGEKYISDMLTIVALYSSYILVISFVQSMSMYFKTYISIGVFIVVWVILLYFREFPFFKYISPMYYLRNLLDSVEFLDFIKFMIVNWCIVFIFTLIGVRRFRKCDL